MKLILLLVFPVLMTAGLMAVSRQDDEDDLDTITVKVDGATRACGLDGTAQSASGKDLDRHKNRYAYPTSGDIDPEVSLAAMLAPGPDKTRFDQEKAASIQGFVVDVKVGGKETCNCEATDPADRDTHIELALAGDPAPQRFRESSSKSRLAFDSL